MDKLKVIVGISFFTALLAACSHKPTSSSPVGGHGTAGVIDSVAAIVTESIDSIDVAILDPNLAVANGEYVIVMECYDYTSYTSPMRAIPNRIIYMPHLVKDAELAKAAPTQTDKDINELYEAMRVQFISAVNANTDFIREYCTSDQRKAHYANLSKWGLFNYGTEI